MQSLEIKLAGTEKVEDTSRSKKSEKDDAGDVEDEECQSRVSNDKDPPCG